MSIEKISSQNLKLKELNIIYTNVQDNLGQQLFDMSVGSLYPFLWHRRIDGDRATVDIGIVTMWRDIRNWVSWLHSLHIFGELAVMQQTRLVIAYFFCQVQVYTHTARLPVCIWQHLIESLICSYSCFNVILKHQVS